MGFADDVAAWAQKAEQRQQQVLAAVVDQVADSIVHGSELTGAPGQPEVTGDLAGSFVKDVNALEGSVLTEHPGAPAIEHGTRKGRAMVLHAGQGGFHSIALTRLGYARIVDDVVQSLPA